MNPRVLLIGRNPTVERDMVAALRSENCEVSFAADCRQALDITGTDQIDVLVLDFDLHCREFSLLASNCNLTERGCPILVLADSLEQLVLASETRADGVLMKPLDPHHARTVVEKLLAGERTQALGESWRPDTAPVLDVLSFERDWGIDE